MKILARARDWTAVAVASGALLLSLGACGSLPAAAERRPSQALPPEQAAATPLWRAAPPPAGVPGNRSGVRLLAAGEAALATLMALADNAERSLDIQQYLIADDTTARALLARVVAAARRGVRVRILVDDLNAAGQDPVFLHLVRHNNIEVRLFNPFPIGRFSLLTRLLGGAHDFRRLNHRMHNKLFIADNALAVTGGRNIGDEYFARNEHSNFVDLDVIVAGPAVRALSVSFDRFWNSPQAWPVERLADGASDGEALGAAAAEPLRLAPAADFLRRELREGRIELRWLPVAVLADRPAKADGAAAAASPGSDEVIADDVFALMRSARRELVVISPYFVPGRRGVELMAELRRRGARVRVITNSLASTDSPPVHIGYARYREKLLEAGVELNEMRPVLGEERPRFRAFRSGLASLHVKAIVIDGATVFVGSMNMDPRSIQTNSELGLVIRSPDIARQVLALVEDVAAGGSYSLTLEDGGLRWHARQNGAPQVWDSEPEAGLQRRFWLWLLSPLAPDEML